MTLQSTVKQEISSLPPQLPRFDRRQSYKNVAAAPSNFFIIFCFACLVIVTARASAQSATSQAEQPCAVRASDFEGWKAQEVFNRWTKIIIVPQLGGRVMQVTFAGHPFLFVNPKFKGKYFLPSSADGKWFNYGGDKIWPMPEGKDDGQHWPGPVSDPLDDGDYKFTVISQGEKCTVRLEGPPDPHTGLQYSREISLSAGSPQISFQSTMRNRADRNIRWSMQTVTQYDTSDARNPREYNRDFWALTPLNSSSTYFNGYHVRSGLADDPSFSPDDGMFCLHWLPLENEVWLDSTAGWLAVNDAAAGYSMIERFHFQPGAEYPGKASLIFYKNGAAAELDAPGNPVLRGANPDDAPYYMEAEINSKMVELQPGETYTMETEWFPVRLTGKVTNVTDSVVIGNPFSVTQAANGVQISGSLSVFSAGKLIAQVQSTSGALLQAFDLGAASPDKPIDLRQQLKTSEKATKVAIHLITDSGNDHVVAETDIRPGAKAF